MLATLCQYMAFIKLLSYLCVLDITTVSVCEVWIAENLEITKSTSTSIKRITINTVNRSVYDDTIPARLNSM